MAKGTAIKLSIKSTAGNVKVLKYSTWSLGYIGKEIPGLQEFAIFMPNTQEEAASTGYASLRMNLPNAYSKIAGNHRGQFVQPTDLKFVNGWRQFQMKEKANFFYVTVDIHIGGEAEDIEVVVPVGLGNRESQLPSKGLSSRKKKLPGKVQTFSISSCMVVTDGQFLTIYIKSHDKKAFTITEETFIAFIQMRYLVSSFSVKTNDAEDIKFSNDAWNELTGPFIADELGSFAFGGDFDFATGKFTASHSGIHSVQVNFNFQTTNCNISSVSYTHLTLPTICSV